MLGNRKSILDFLIRLLLWLLMFLGMGFELWLLWPMLVAQDLSCWGWRNIVSPVVFIVAPVAVLRLSRLRKLILRLYKRRLLWIWWNLMLLIVWMVSQFRNALLVALQEPSKANHCLMMGGAGVLLVIIVIAAFPEIAKIFRNRWKLSFHTLLKNELPLCSERGISYPEIRARLEPWLPEVHRHARYLFRQSLQILVSTPKESIAGSRDFCLWVWLPFLEPSLVPLALEVLRENVPEDKVCALLHPWIENGILLVVDRLNLGKSKDYPPPGWNSTLWGWILDAEILDNGDISGDKVHEKEDFLRVQALLKHCTKNRETGNP